MISVVLDPALTYPDPGDQFSPDECYPEYRYEHLSPSGNLVYRRIRDGFVQAGLDPEHLGTPAWNPLGRFIRPGNRVFLLCNFANERRPNERLENFRARCSHGSVIRALTDYILIATGPNGCVQIGNAPTQFCHWDAVLRDTEALQVFDFYRSLGAPVEPRDLRLYITDASQWGSIRHVERRDESDAVHVLLDRDSLFDELDRRQPNRYRVMNYDPRRTESFHSNGHHDYLVNRHILDADVIFSTTKLKTHEKVGISCAIKGMVGTVAHKDSLPHHRYGAPSIGGDEYPNDSVGFARIATALHERIQQVEPDTSWGSLLRLTFRVFRRLIRRWTPVVEGAWWGNDTTWRMAVDLARIATYANPHGELQETPCRRHLVLTDGIIGGEGEGPAYATGVPSGILLFGDDLVAADYVNAILMGFDPQKIPLVREAAHLQKYPLLTHDLSRLQAIVNGHPLTVAELSSTERPHFEPQAGWRGHL